MSRVRPHLLAGPRVVRDDDARLGAALGHAAAAGDGLAAGHDGARRLVGGVHRVVEYLRLPREPAGRRVEGVRVVVGAGRDDEVAVDGDVPLRLRQPRRDVVVEVVGPPPAVLPEQVARDRVHRLDDVARVRHVEHPAVGQRRALLTARAERARPHHAQLADVVPVDLVEGAVAPAVEGAAPRQPVAGRGVLEHRVGDRDEAGVFLGLRRSGERRERTEGKHRKGESRALSEHRKLLREVEPGPRPADVAENGTMPTGRQRPPAR